MFVFCAIRDMMGHIRNSSRSRIIPTPSTFTVLTSPVPSCLPPVARCPPDCGATTPDCGS